MIFAAAFRSIREAIYRALCARSTVHLGVPPERHLKETKPASQ